MKKMYKVMLLVLCAALLVAGSVLGTLAYLKMETDPVKNTFTVGQVGITLDEAKTDKYGVTLTGSEAARVMGNEYKLIPGHTYDKDPKITVNADSEACWVFAKLENGLDGAADFDIDTTNWTKIATGVYAYNTKLSAGGSATLFTEFTFGATADPEQYKNATIEVTGYAVQADGFDDALSAWNASGFGA